MSSNKFIPNFFSKLTGKFGVLEKWFFLLIVLLNLAPIFIGKFFPTMDGAAHLYNANLINNLLFGSNAQLHDFFIMNPDPIPNWTGHFILSFFNLFLPAFLAEKILLLFYFIGLPYAFRKLLRVAGAPHRALSYFIFPFSYSMVFLFGFYNFSIAIVFMLLTVGYWLKKEEKLSFSFKEIFLFFGLLILTYFSHLVVFATTLMIIGIDILLKVVLRSIDDKEHWKEYFKVGLRKSLFFLVAALLPLLLFLYYFYTHPATGNYNFLDRAELISWLKNIRPLIVFNGRVEEVYTKKIYYVLVVLFIIAIYTRINDYSARIKTLSTFSIPSFFKGIRSSDLWLISSIIILILYFVLPDSDGRGSFISVRFGWMFFVLLIIWLATHKFPGWLLFIVVTVVLVSNFKLNYYYSTTINRLAKVASNCYKAAEHIPENSIVLPLNYSDKWMAGHFSNYIGVDKPMVILENYECNTGYFPVRWNDEKIYNTKLGDQGVMQFPCLYWKINGENKEVPIDFVFVLGQFDRKKDNCNQSIKSTVLTNYELIYENEDCSLYAHKK